MNTSKLKSYAPQARKDFLKAVTDKAALLGITSKEQKTAEITGDTAIINGRPYPAKAGRQQRDLIEKVIKEGFQIVMEAIAYSWFNRFAAIRFMELHDYLGHGLRVLSHPNGLDEPEILEQAVHIELTGLNKQKVADLKLAGGKDEDLYQTLLKAQCNELNRSMPFLFEPVNDCTEILMPENLLHSDSVIRKMVNAIDEEDWKEIEIIGWLYQFYISEKKDQVIGKVVKSEDIPAATQLFTPRWIVEYMVQNSLGRTWLDYRPNSPLKEKMDYYIEPAEQSEEVKQQLAALVPDELNPEDLTLIDPACGSGHILVVAYDILFQIYKENGYKDRNIPRLILEKNLFGLDIDQRAVQLATFALLMKARKDDSRILNREGLKFNVHEMPESKDLNAEQIHYDLFQAEKTEFMATIQELIETFQHGKTYGSLITIDQRLYEDIVKLREAIIDKGETGDGLEIIAKQMITPFIEVGLVLGRKFDAVVANPPYMGRKAMNKQLKIFADNSFPKSKSDLFAMFMEHGFYLAKQNGFNSQINMQSWMFLSTYEGLRRKLLEEKAIITMAHFGARAFSTISGEVVQTTAFTARNIRMSKHKPVFFRLTEGNECRKKNALKAGEFRFDHIIQDNFKKVLGSPIAYWISQSICSSFESGKSIGKGAKKGLSCSGTDSFYRLFWEIDLRKVSFCGGNKWYPITKGGPFRKWYGNNEYLINWENKGFEIKNRRDKSGKPLAVIRNEEYYFSAGSSWNDVSTGTLSCRYTPPGYIPTDSGPMLYSNDYLKTYTCLLNSCVSMSFTRILCPTIHFGVGQIAGFPVYQPISSIDSIFDKAIQISKADWDFFETSWDFKFFPWLSENLKAFNTSQSFLNWQEHCHSQINEMQKLEIENNDIFTKSYKLENELSTNVSAEQITLARADRADDIKRLISFGIGCMMGRYSLDQEGLVYAQSGNEGFDDTCYPSFPADEDGILPLTDMDWGFQDDITNRFEEFLKVVWDEKTLVENLEFVAGVFNPKQNETPKETIRRYLSTKFFGDHLKIYKKRPIYWLVSSGKEKAFEGLIYLHRYHDGTLARMRNDYVIPLQGKINSKILYHEEEISRGGSAVVIRQHQKNADTLKKKQLELARFDELLRHYADQKISLDLDDGVKVNYGKFGTLLAKVKEITGIKPGELN